MQNYELNIIIHLKILNSEFIIHNYISGEYRSRTDDLLRARQAL